MGRLNEQPLQQGLADSNTQIKIAIIIIIISIPIVEYYGAIKNDFIDLYLLMWKDIAIIQGRKDNESNI